MHRQWWLYEGAVGCAWRNEETVFLLEDSISCTCHCPTLHPLNAILDTRLVRRDISVTRGEHMTRGGGRPAAFTLSLSSSNPATTWRKYSSCDSNAHFPSTTRWRWDGVELPLPQHLLLFLLSPLLSCCHHHHRSLYHRRNLKPILRQAKLTAMRLSLPNGVPFHSSTDWSYLALPSRRRLHCQLLFLLSNRLVSPILPPPAPLSPTASSRASSHPFSSPLPPMPRSLWCPYLLSLL